MFFLKGKQKKEGRYPSKLFFSKQIKQQIRTFLNESVSDMIYLEAGSKECMRKTKVNLHIFANLLTNPVF